MENYIDLSKPETYINLVNGLIRNKRYNRLTVFFTDYGDAYIEEIIDADKDLISSQERNGQALSITLPEVLFISDIEQIAEVLRVPIKSCNWEQVKHLMHQISDLEIIDYYQDYIDCAGETPVEDDEMTDLIKKHKGNYKAIKDAILCGGREYVWLDEWLGKCL